MCLHPTTVARRRAVCMPVAPLIGTDEAERLVSNAAGILLDMEVAKTVLHATIPQLHSPHLARSLPGNQIPLRRIQPLRHPTVDQRLVRRPQRIERELHAYRRFASPPCPSTPAYGVLGSTTLHSTPRGPKVYGLRGGETGVTHRGLFSAVVKRVHPQRRTLFGDASHRSCELVTEPVLRQRARRTAGEATEDILPAFILHRAHSQRCARPAAARQSQ